MKPSEKIKLLIGPYPKNYTPDAMDWVNAILEYLDKEDDSNNS